VTVTVCTVNGAIKTLRACSGCEAVSEKLITFYRRDDTPATRCINILYAGCIVCIYNPHGRLFWAIYTIILSPLAACVYSSHPFIRRSVVRSVGVIVFVAVKKVLRDRMSVVPCRRLSLTGLPLMSP